MKTSLIIIVVSLSSQFSNAQYWIAGDTTEYAKISVNQHFMSGDKVAFDIDCDGREDFYLKSTPPVDAFLPWSRLDLWMDEAGEALNTGIGKISTFDAGDTILFENYVWTEHLSFIYGTGELGSYGRELINNKFIAFRKNAEDTSYCFLRFSNSGINFTVHEVYIASNCNPLGYEQDLTEKVLIFPNPFESNLTIQGAHIKKIRFFDNTGKEVISSESNVNGSNVNNLTNFPSGVYIAEIQFSNNTKKHIKIVKK